MDNRIATASQGTIAVRRIGSRKPFSTALGVVTAVCFLAAAILFLLQLFPLALVTSVLGLIAITTALVQVYWSNNDEDLAGGRYGRGPHRQFMAKPNQALFEHLAQTMKSLREASEERRWKIDWATLDKQFSQARAKADANDYLEAVRIQSLLIIELMRQIRKQRSEIPGDSAIDL